MEPKPFANAARLRAWFATNAAKESELWVLFHKVAAKKKGITYAEALDEALAVGWIDGVRKGVDEESYEIRFTPRKKGSYWSNVNIRKAEALIEQKRMTPAGLAAFAARDAQAERRYSFENRPQELPAEAEKALRRDRSAWTFWQAQPPYYRKTATWFVVSAKREETRARRLAQLIACSARGERLPHLVSPAKAKRGGSRGGSPRRSGPARARGTSGAKG